MPKTRLLRFVNAQGAEVYSSALRRATLLEQGFKPATKEEAQTPLLEQKQKASSSTGTSQTQKIEKKKANKSPSRSSTRK